MPAHYSHTITHNLIVFNGVRECFAFAKPLKPAAQSKACQRVCLSQRTTKTSYKQADEKEHRSDNITYTQAGVLYFVGQGSSKFKVQFFVGSSVVKIPACVWLKTVMHKRKN